MNSRRTEEAMRKLLSEGIWPTATKLNEVMPSRMNGRPDLNGRECKIRECLAEEFGWVRVRHGNITRWQKKSAGG